MSLCGKEGPGSRRFGRSLIPVTDGRSRRIVLKNSNFCIDHNTGTAGGLDEKFLRGFGGPTGFAACDAPICPAVRTIGGDDATRAKTRFSRWLNFRVFQHRVMGGSFSAKADTIGQDVEETRNYRQPNRAEHRRLQQGMHRRSTGMIAARTPIHARRWLYAGAAWS